MNYTQAIEYAYPNTVWSLSDNDYSTLQWDASNVAAKPTDAELQTAYQNYQTAVAAAIAANANKRANVIAAIQPAVGKNARTGVSASERNALILGLLMAVGAIDSNLNVQDPNTWLP